LSGATVPDPKVGQHLLDEMHTIDERISHRCVLVGLT